MRSIPALALIFALSTSMTPLPDTPATIRAKAVALDPKDPARRRAGALGFLGGWVLTSEQPSFGGISALHARHGQFLAITDAGAVIRFRLGADGVPTDALFSVLPAGPGRGQGKSDRDAESMAMDSRSGAIWIGFEGHNAIWRYAADLGRAVAHAEPAAMKSWPRNGGPEAMTRLADGRFIVFGEASGSKGTTEALLFAADPAKPGTKPLRFFYRPPKGYVPTDAGLLPDGKLLVLNRHFSLLHGVAATLTLVDPEAIARDTIVEGRFLARLAPPLTVDNMEALAIEREAGRTILWLASDDNFSPLQRTLLLKFALDGD